MAQKKESEKEKKGAKKRHARESSDSSLSIEARYGIYGVLSFVGALVLILAAFNAAGAGGVFLYKIFSSLFGIGYFLAPILLLLLGYSFIKSERPNIGIAHSIGAVLFLGSGLAIVDIASSGQGGFIGKIAAMPFIYAFGIYAAILILGGMLLIGIMVMMDAVPDWNQLATPFTALWKKLTQKRELKKNADEDTEEAYEEEVETTVEVHVPDTKKEVVEEEPEPVEPIDEEEAEEVVSKKIAPRRHSDYVLPPLSLLAGDKGKPNTGDIKANANIIKRTLQTFGMEVEMDEITVGPTVTRYALKPAEGIKLSRITGLASDLSLALAAHPIRIEAPIPGKSLVGIEIPNKAKSIVGLGTLLSDPSFKGSDKRLMVALGRTISGGAIISNVAKMPHALVAGATGSGKSVTIHSIITSLLYRNGPDDLRLIFIDPKRVELTLYNGIPHLLTPVITEAKKAILALKWAAKEMDRRYDLLEKARARDIDSYNGGRQAPKNTEAAEGEDTNGPLPYIVIVIDELADIMQSYPRELESAIVRLAQMSRAVGIHLILSTQRPSVNVITGLIKANIPARIALQVASQIDSRTILDAGGAEKLLGAGDMLWSAGDMASPERIQSAFISENEVKAVVKFIIDHSDDEGGELSLTGNNLSGDKSIFEASIGGDDEADDDLYEEARETVIAAQKASTSFLQRKLGVGYARAARLIDMLESRGVVGPGSGAKPREVIEKTVTEDREGFQ